MIPLLAIDMAGAILEEILVQTGQNYDHALLITTDIVESVGGAQGHILILPEARQLEVLLKALGVGRGA